MRQARAIRFVAVAIAVALVACGSGFGINAVSIEMPGGKVVARISVGTGNAGREFARAVGAVTGLGLALEFFRRPAGENLYHATNGLGAVQARARPTHDLDTLDLIERQVLPGCSAEGGGADLDAVDQDERVVGISAAQEDVGAFPIAAADRGVDTGLAGEQLGDALGLRALDVRARDNADRGERFIRRARGARGGDDDGLLGGYSMGGGQNGGGHRRRTE